MKRTLFIPLLAFALFSCAAPLSSNTSENIDTPVVEKDKREQTKEESKRYTLIYENCDNVDIRNLPLFYTEGRNIVLDDPQSRPEGLTFGGWYSSSSLLEEDKVLELNSDLVTKVSSSLKDNGEVKTITLYAKWNKETSLSFTFDNVPYVGFTYDVTRTGIGGIIANEIKDKYFKDVKQDDIVMKENSFYNLFVEWDSAEKDPKIFSSFFLNEDEKLLSFMDTNNIYYLYNYFNVGTDGNRYLVIHERKDGKVNTLICDVTNVEVKILDKTFYDANKTLFTKSEK